MRTASSMPVGDVLAVGPLQIHPAELVWGRTMRPGDRSVDVYVRKLRVKLDIAQPDFTFIHTHFGFGYRLAPVRKPGNHAEFADG